MSHLCKRIGIGIWAVILAADSAAHAALPPDLALVPPDAAGFVHIRAAELWKAEPLAEVRQMIELAGPQNLKVFDEQFVPHPSTVERLTVVFPTTKTFGQLTPNRRPIGMSALLIVGTSKPFDKAELLKALMPKAREKKHQGRSYFLDDEQWAGLYLPDDRTLVYGSEDSIWYLLSQLAENKASGPLQPGLERAAAKHQVVVGLNPGLLAREKEAQAVPPPLQPLLEAQLVMATLDVGTDIQLGLELQYADAAKAQAGAKATQVALQLLSQQVIGNAITELEDQLKRRRHWLEFLAGPNGKPDPAAVDPEPTNPERLPEKVMNLVALGQLRRLDAELKKIVVETKGTTVLVPFRLPLTQSGALLVAGGFVTTLGHHAEGTFDFVAEKVSTEAGGEGDGIDQRAKGNLEKFAEALEKYHAKNGHFPPPAIYGTDGQALLSWRVLLLPYLGEEELFKQFKQDEAWDSPHNKPLLVKMPKVFQPQYHEYDPTWKTPVQVVTGPGTLFDGPKGVRKVDIKDGLETTLLLQYGPSDMRTWPHWTRPVDLAFDAKKPLPRLGHMGGVRIHAVTADGKFRLLKQDTPQETLRALVTPNGGEKVKLPE